MSTKVMITLLNCKIQYVFALVVFFFQNALRAENEGKCLNFIVYLFVYALVSVYVLYVHVYCTYDKMSVGVSKNVCEHLSFSPFLLIIPS